MSVNGKIFNIQPYSVHDGPGIRTVVFLKGCPLSCKWCSNPEGIAPRRQLKYNRNLCAIECSKCLVACNYNALSKKDNHLAIDSAKCTVCTTFNCVSACACDALTVCGRDIDSKDLCSIIEKDSHFFGNDGGITLSGGEPFFQPGFTLSVLIKCKEKGISTAIESSLYADFSIIEELLPFVDFFMFDLKLMDKVKHIDYCGVDNALILANIKELVKIAEIPLLPRIPLIPGVNDDTENIRESAIFMKGLGIKYVNVLPYINLGSDKYAQLGYEYKLDNVKPYKDFEFEAKKKLFRQLDIVPL